MDPDLFPPSPNASASEIASHRTAVSLIRLQMLAPMAVLISLGTVIVCAGFVKPSMADLSDMYPTLVTPNGSMIGGYWLALCEFFLIQSILSSQMLILGGNQIHCSSLSASCFTSQAPHTPSSSLYTP